MSEFTAIQEYAVESISQPIKYIIHKLVESGGISRMAKYIIYKLTEFIRVIDKFVFRQVPASAASGYATIEQIEGNTVKFNQLVNISRYGSGQDFTLNNSTQEIIFNLSSYTNSNRTLPDNIIVNPIVGHSYFVRVIVVQGNFSGGFGIRYGEKTTAYITSGITSNNGIISPISTQNIRINIGTDGLVITTQLKIKINIIDLTAIFGAGNEPTTVAEYEAWRDARGLPSVASYNPGELISCKMSSVKSVGFNQWDEEWEVGFYSISNGNKTTANDSLRTKNKIKIISGSHIFIKNPYRSGSGRYLYVYAYDENENFLSYRRFDWVDCNIQYSNKVHYLTFAIPNQVLPVTYNNDICVNIYDDSKNGTYKPYITDSADIDVTTITGINSITNVREVIFPNGMMSAKNIADVLDLVSDIAIKKLYRINLGNFNYSYDSQYAFFQSYDNIIIGETKKYTSNFIIQAPYFNNGYNNSNSNMANAPNYSAYKRYQNGRLFIKNTNYTSGSDLKTSLNGVYLIAERQTYITYTDLQDANGNPLNPRYKVEQGGTEQVLPVNTSTPTTVAPTLTTTYTKDVH